MAVLANDPAKEAENTETTNVLGPSAPSQPSQAPSGSQPMGGAPSSPTSTTGAKKGSSGASSGMFQNIKKYAAANKPQATKMAGAVTQNVGSQAAEVGKAVQKQQQQFQAGLSQQQAKLGQAQQFTQGVIQDITGGGQQAPAEQVRINKPMVSGEDRSNLPSQKLSANELVQISPEHTQAIKDYRAGKTSSIGTVDPLYKGSVMPLLSSPVLQPEPVQIGPSEEDYTKFRGYMTGGTGQFGDVAALNIAKQEQQARQMQQLADQAGTSQGRSELLKQTFAKQAPYSAGMRGLDDLIVASDRGAREQLASGVQGTVDQSLGNITDIKRQALKGLAGYERGRGGFVSGLQEQLTTGSGDIATGAESRAEQMRTDRQNLADQLGVTEEQAQEFIQGDLTGRTNLGVAELVNAMRSRQMANAVHRAEATGTISQGNLNFTSGGGLRNRLYDPVGSTTTAETLQELAARTAVDPSKFDIRTQKYKDQYGNTRTKQSYYDKETGKAYEGPTADARIASGGGFYSQDMSNVNKLIKDKFSESDLELLGMSKDDLALDIMNRGGYAGGDRGSSYGVKDIEALRKGIEQNVSGVTGRQAAENIYGTMSDEGATSYEDLLGAKDISTQSAASQEEVSKYNALQDLLSGRDVGDRALMTGSEQTGTAAANQELLSKVRADILKRIGQGEA